MSDIRTTNIPVAGTKRHTGKRSRAESRPSIQLPNGDVGDPRARLADEWQVSERTIARMDLPTLYFAGVAYHPRVASQKVIAERIHRRNEPAPRTMRRGTYRTRKRKEPVRGCGRLFSCR